MNSPAQHFGLTPSQFKEYDTFTRLRMIEIYRRHLIKRSQSNFEKKLVICEGEHNACTLRSSGIPAIALPKMQNLACDFHGEIYSFIESKGTSAILDIETLATSPRSLITEISIIIFDRATLTVIDHLEIFPDFFEQLAAGREFEADTLAFHRKNGTLPQIGNHTETPWLHAIVKIEELFNAHKPKHIWIQGTDFDRPIIEDFCKAHNQPLPWRFSKSRDARTAYDMAFPDQPHPKRPHRALEDCKETLADLISALKEINRLHAI
jgi:hypothetical protein